MSDNRINVLLVEDNPDDVTLIEELIWGTSGRYEIFSTSTLSEAMDAVQREAFDVVLLDLALPDSIGVETLQQIRQLESPPPVVILSATDREEVINEALRQGAQDYLVKGQFAGEVITRAIRHAIERYQIVAQLEEERAERRRLAREKQLIASLSGEGLSVTARQMGLESLRDSDPAAFDLLVASYGEQLDLQLERRAHGQGAEETQPIVVRMSERLGEMRAGPRDVLDIHMESVKSKCAEAEPQRADAYVEEARYLVIRLLGHLVSYYRTRDRV